MRLELTGSIGGVTPGARGFFSIVNYMSLSILPTGREPPHTSSFWWFSPGWDLETSLLKLATIVSQALRAGCRLASAFTILCAREYLQDPLHNHLICETLVSFPAMLGNIGQTLLIDNWPVMVMSPPRLWKMKVTKEGGALLGRQQALYGSTAGSISHNTFMLPSLWRLLTSFFRFT